jgi:ribonucleoside-diphosphate reductase alpha subunit
VTKRDGTHEKVHFDKITSRISKLCYNLDESIVDPPLITQKIISRIYSGIKTTELDDLASQVCMSMIVDDYDFGILGSRLTISNHQKNTKSKLMDICSQLMNNSDVNGNIAPLMNDDIYTIIKKNEEALEAMIDHSRDYLIDYFGFKTLERSYLLKVTKNGKDKVIVERPQHLFLRVAIGIHGDDMESVKKTYDNMSLKRYTHATPTLFNASSPYPAMSSCFLLGTHDSIEGIFTTITDCANISKWSGGIGIHISNIRSKGSYIRKTGGTSEGIMPMLKVYNDTARMVNQSGKRNGSFAIYLEPHHADVFTFLDAKKNSGSDEMRARDLFYALYISDLFMECVESNGEWYLMDPDQSFGLNDVYGEEYKTLYYSYVKEGKYVRCIKARELWEHIIASQIEHGLPYMAYKDSVNRKSNQKNLGTIKSLNLCIEIAQYSDDNETACCNLSSVSLPHLLESFPTNEWYALLSSSDQEKFDLLLSSPNILIYSSETCEYCKLLKHLLAPFKSKIVSINKYEAEILRQDCSANDFVTIPQVFVKNNDGRTIHLGGYDDLWAILKPRINYKKLEIAAYDLTVNLNKVIDKNYYPTEKAKYSNFKHRPIGIGVQGLADVFMMLKLEFTSDESQEINKLIFETLYWGAMNASYDLVAIHKEMPYSTFGGSPLSQGLFQFDLWNVKVSDLSGRYDWESMREKVVATGVRNSLLIALMPTASTASIFGNTESFEPITSNLYTRNVLSGVFTIVNKYLIKDLVALDLWTKETKDRLVFDKGSVQNIKGLPRFLKNVYKTSYEIDQKQLIKMSADRGVFVCQSQSLNLFFDKPSFKTLTSTHFSAWKAGLKTGMYYLRTRAGTSGQNFSLDTQVEKKFRQEDEEEGCLNCSA